VDFRFYPLRFEFTAKQSLFFPPRMASNILRGALGVIFRSIACVPECRLSGNPRTCEIRHSCPYAKIFEPVADGLGPSGLADSPRPFVFRTRHLDGHAIQPGKSFYFDLNVFSLQPETLACFVLSFAALAREGLGPNRGKAELGSVRRLSAGQFPEQIIYSPAGQMTASLVEPVTLKLDPEPSRPGRIRIEFLSPTELKHEHKIAERPEFPILFGRIRDRIGTLTALYGGGPLEMDYQALGARAGLVKMTGCAMRREESRRRSSRTGQTHSIGGFLGTADYEGDLSEFLPWLEAARYTGVGRQAVWGKGEIRLCPSAGTAEVPGMEKCGTRNPSGV
jgi:hypothetical protein